MGILTVILLASAWAACSGASTVAPTAISTPGAPTATAGNAALESDAGAEVIGISVSGDPGSYTFSVTVESPDTGCGQYADWWEVVSPEGKLIYRRVLLHSHVDEQPFTRSGGPVDVQPGETIVVQAHMNGAGYVGVMLRGSVAGGFNPAVGNAAAMENKGPLPSNCAF